MDYPCRHHRDSIPATTSAIAAESAPSNGPRFDQTIVFSNLPAQQKKKSGNNNDKEEEEDAAISRQCVPS
jgi:hypothetical protein